MGQSAEVTQLVSFVVIFVISKSLPILLFPFQACNPYQKQFSATLCPLTMNTGYCGNVKQEVNSDAHKES